MLVEEHSEFLTDSIMEFMEQEKHADLQRMFDLFVAAESPAALNGLKVGANCCKVKCHYNFREYLESMWNE